MVYDPLCNPSAAERMVCCVLVTRQHVLSGSGDDMKQLRHDLNYGISAALLVAATAAILTGIVAHLWDLNDFVYHTYAGYAMTGLSLAHVWLNWSRMVAYARFRLAGRAQHRAPATSVGLAPPALSEAVAGDRRLITQARPLAVATPALLWRMIISRRGFLSLAAGGLGGFLAGRGLRQQPVIPQGSDLGVVYHQWSKPGVIDVLGTVANWGQQPPLYKEYPQARQVALPTPGDQGGLRTEEAIRRRRSTRDYSGQPMTLPELSRILFLMGGRNNERWGHQLRTAPSSGALYPIEVYPVVHRVAGLQPGLYHYGVKEHTLAELRVGDLRETVVRQGLMQQFLGEASVVLFLTVIFQRMRFKYQDRTYRYGLIEAGHLGQNIYLAATSLGLGACAVGAFMDDEINALLGVDGKTEAAIYMLAVGKVKE